MAGEITGGCHCGAIRYRITAEPVAAGHCQCTDCRRLSASGHTSSLRVPAGAVTFTGTPKGYVTQADSGNRLERFFCANCGAPLYSKSSGAPEFLNIRASSLDDPPRFKPQRVIFAASVAPWDCIDPTLPRFPGMPPR